MQAKRWLIEPAATDQRPCFQGSRVRPLRHPAFGLVERNLTLTGSSGRPSAVWTTSVRRYVHARAVSVDRRARSSRMAWQLSVLLRTPVTTKGSSDRGFPVSPKVRSTL